MGPRVPQGTRGPMLYTFLNKDLKANLMLVISVISKDELIRIAESAEQQK